jgi:hypothetical protein
MPRVRLLLLLMLAARGSHRHRCRMRRIDSVGGAAAQRALALL